MTPSVLIVEPEDKAKPGLCDQFYRDHAFSFVQLVSYKWNAMRPEQLTSWIDKLPELSAVVVVIPPAAIGRNPMDIHGEAELILKELYATDHMVIEIDDKVALHRQTRRNTLNFSDLDPGDDPFLNNPVDRMRFSRDVHCVSLQRDSQVRPVVEVFLMGLKLQSDPNLLFRLYMPTGRLYAEEADKLLRLFQDWLNQSGRAGTRLGGYSTRSGRVYEFFGPPNMTSTEVSTRMEEFTDLLEQCESNPEAAVAHVEARTDLNYNEASALVTRYGKEARRARLDGRHVLDTRILAIRQRLESDMIELGPGQIDAVNQAIATILPNPSVINPGVLLQGVSPNFVTINLNPNFNNVINSTIIDEVNGTVNLNPNAKELLALVREYGDSRINELESAVNELEDQDAPSMARTDAKRRLLGFLKGAAGKIAPAALETLQKYVESKMGLS